MIDEALQHALTADDTAFAIQLIEQQRLNLLAQFDYATLERWLSPLPETAFEQSPALLLMKCWIAVSLHRMKSASVFQLTQQAEACLENPDLPLDRRARAILQAEIAAVKGGSCFWRNDFRQALQYLSQATDDLPSSYVFMRVYTIFLTALSLVTIGQAPEGTELIQLEEQKLFWISNPKSSVSE